MVVGASLAIAGSSFIRLGSNARAQALEEEGLNGDPNIPLEYLSYDSLSIDLMTDASRSIGVDKPKQALADEILSVALSYVGFNERRNASEIELWLAIFGIPTRRENGRLQKFCAAGLSWAACQAYCNISPSQLPYNQESKKEIFSEVLPDLNRFYFRPHCAVRKIKEDAERRQTWKPQRASTAPKPGWLVIFDWDGDDQPNHIGLVRGTSENKLLTIEFNTTTGSGGDQSDGGGVYIREREYRYVQGYVAWV